MASCLFCTSPSPPPAQPSPLVFQGDSVINEQLKAFLVLKHILKIPQETLRRFLQQNNGQFNPEIWLNLCSSCADSVHQFLETLKEISRLEKKLNGIETELKRKMQNSKEVASGSPVAEQIRTCVLYGYSIPEPSFEVLENPELQLDDDDNDDQIHSEFLLEPTSPIDIKQEFEVHQESVATFAADILSSSPPHDHYSSLFLDPDDMYYETPPATSPPQQLNPQGKRRTIKLQDGNYSYSCENCPYGSTNIHRYRLHLKNHEPGSKAVVCPKCGWYVMRIGAHNGKAHSRTSDKVGGKKVRRLLTYYKCAECQALLGTLDDYKEHEILHENGGGEICMQCGWRCQRIWSHNKRWHPTGESAVCHEPPRCIKIMPKRKEKAVPVEVVAERMMEISAFIKCEVNLNGGVEIGEQSDANVLL